LILSILTGERVHLSVLPEKILGNPHEIKAFSERMKRCFAQSAAGAFLQRGNPEVVFANAGWYTDKDRDALTCMEGVLEKG